MSGGGTFVLGVATVAAISSLIAAAVKTEASPITGLATVSGIVSDGVTHQPIAGAQVILGVGVIDTGSDGRFVFEGIPPGTYNFSISAPGYQTINL